MKKGFIGLMSVLLGMMIQAPSVLAGTLVEFEGGIGVIPVARIATIPTTTTPDCINPTGGTQCRVDRNDLRGVQPGGQPWVIRTFEAKIKENGDIRAEGRGLVLAGGDAIGTGGGVTVFATLFCANDGNVQHNTSPPVALQADGDFKIKDTLNPPPPATCTSPVLLIRVAAGRWIAAGIPKVKDED